MRRARVALWFRESVAALFGLGLAWPVFATCAKTTWQPIDPPYTIEQHNAYALTDPSGQQTALFDLTWGGTLVSLKYNNQEMMWGPNPGGMIQPAYFGDPLHNISGGGAWWYNPEQAGGPAFRGTPVFGAVCSDANTLMIIGGATDYFGGMSGYRVGNPVFLYSPSNQYHVYDTNKHFAAPYTITTIATFVPNPGGSPSYYLKITQTILNNHPTENFTFGFQISGYVPARLKFFKSFPANCTAAYQPGCGPADVPNLIGGLYSDLGLSDGTALYVRPRSDWPFLGPVPSVFILHDSSCQPAGPADPNCLAHTVGPWATDWSVPPSTPRTMDFYVLVGSWAQACTFATGSPASCS